MKDLKVYFYCVFFLFESESDSSVKRSNVSKREYKLERFGISTFILTKGVFSLK